MVGLWYLINIGGFLKMVKKMSVENGTNIGNNDGSKETWRENLKTFFNHTKIMHKGEQSSRS